MLQQILSFFSFLAQNVEKAYFDQCLGAGTPNAGQNIQQVTQILLANMIFCYTILKRNKKIISDQS